MSRKLQAALALLCMTTYAAAGTTVLGTASASGNMRVDGYQVQGDATLFNGSVVETKEASAELRVAHGVEITLAKSSRGTVYNSHFVLQRGETEVAAPESFALEANGLHVTAGKPNSVGIVTLTPKHAVEVAAVSGRLEVRDGQGLLLSNVLPGKPLSFAQQTPTGGNIAAQFLSMAGMVSYENGHYYLTSDLNSKYRLIGGKNFKQFVGDKVVVSGNFQPVGLSEGVVGTINVQTVQLNGPGKSRKGAWFITGVALGGAGTVGYVIYDATHPTPISR